MNKGLSLLLALVVFSSQLLAQEVPQNIFFGSVNIKINSDARTKIQTEVNNLTINRNYLDKILGKMLTHLPTIERILEEEKVPDEFKYLCVQESFLNADARSTSDAIGFWQFKKETAKGFYLRIDGVMDERKHLSASTKAACSYFKKHNDLLGNWMASLLSYRLGYTNFRKSNAMDWANKQTITVTGDTDWYVLRFLAYKLVLETEYSRAKQNPPYNNPVLFEYSKTRGKSLSEIANQLGITVSEIESNNTWLNSKSIPDDKDYVIYLVVDRSKYQTLTTLSSSPTYTPSGPLTADIPLDDAFPVLVRKSPANTNPNEAIFYEINGRKGILAIEGDTPERIASRADISLKRFLKFNDLEENDRIIPNQVYYLKKKDHKAQVAFHTVRGNESLWQISQMYGIHLQDLMDKNRIPTVQKLGKGRVLWLIDTRPQNTDPQFDSSITNPIPEPRPIEPKQPEKPYVEPKQPEKPYVEPKQPEKPYVEPKQPEKPYVEPKQPEKPYVEPKQPEKPYVEPKQPEKPYVEPKQPEKPYADINTKNIYVHRVESKQTYFSIARQYNMKVDEIYQLNNLSASEVLRVGQDIKVFRSTSSGALGADQIKEQPKDPSNVYPTVEPYNPSKDKNSTTVIQKDNTEKPVPPAVQPDPVQPMPAPPSTFKASEAKPHYRIIHTVQKGETLFRVAKFYDVSVDNLKEWNNLTVNTVEIGQEITIYGGNIRPNFGITDSTPPKNETLTPPSVQQEQSFHIVKAGETAFRISQIYRISVNQLLLINGLKSPNISVGQKLIIR